MTHDDIEANDLTSQYAAGRLADDKEREFEAHLVDCPRCLDAVESEVSLREGLRTIGSESVAWPASSAVHPSSTRGRAYLFLQLAAAVLLAVTAGLGVWLSRSTADLNAARTERDGLQLRTRQAEQAARALERKLAEVPPASKEAAAPAPAVVPATVFALATVRGSSTAGDGPVNHVQIGGRAGVLVFSLEIPAMTGSGDYAVSLKDQAARVVWSGGAFAPPASDVLSVAVDSALLPAGDYLLELSHRPAAGGSTIVGRYTFRVIRN